MWPGPYGQGGGCRKYVLASLDQSLAADGRRLRRHLLLATGSTRRRRSRRRWARSTPPSARARRSTPASRSYSGPRTKEAVEILRAMGTPLLIHQPSYSMLNRWVEEDLLDVLGDEGVGCIAFSPLAQGMLTDKYLNGVPGGLARGAGQVALDRPADRAEPQAHPRPQPDGQGARPVARADGARVGAARPARHVGAHRRLVGRRSSRTASAPSRTSTSRRRSSTRSTSTRSRAASTSGSAPARAEAALGPGPAAYARSRMPPGLATRVGPAT